jgi:hypothetical protein
MPNQRKAGTRLVGAYLEAVDQERLVAEARRRGMTVADLVRELVKDYIGRHNGKSDQARGRGRR